MSIDPTTAPEVPAYLQDSSGLFYRVGGGTPGAPGVTDHGALTGLTDDDHPQYHNDARGDARYVNVTGDTITGNLHFAATSGITGDVNCIALRDTAGTQTGYIDTSNWLNLYCGPTAAPTGGLSVKPNQFIIYPDGVYVQANALAYSTAGGLQSQVMYDITSTTPANMAILAAGPKGKITRSTSSLRYKSNVQDAPDMGVDLLALRPITYLDKEQVALKEADATAVDPQRYPGFIAEEVATTPTLGSLLVAYDDQGRPDAVYYDRVVVALVQEVQKLRAEVNALRGV